jgi:hypothetical protein
MRIENTDNELTFSQTLFIFLFRNECSFCHSLWKRFIGWSNLYLIQNSTFKIQNSSYYVRNCFATLSLAMTIHLTSRNDKPIYQSLRTKWSNPSLRNRNIHYVRDCFATSSLAMTDGQKSLRKRFIGWSNLYLIQNSTFKIQNSSYYVRNCFATSSLAMTIPLTSRNDFEYWFSYPSITIIFVKNVRWLWKLNCFFSSSSSA